MATKSSPERSVRESIETPASRARGSSPCPGFPATASATCVSVHRIVASISWLSPGFGRSVHLVRKAHLCAFSPVEGSSFRLVCELLRWLAGPRPTSADERATCQILSHPGAPHNRDRARPFALLRDRQNEWSGRRRPDSPHGPCPPAARYRPLALRQSPA